MNMQQYPHQPIPTSNFVFSSLRLFAWFLFRPSAWHSYCKQVDETLKPNFCLAELSNEQWNNIQLQRMLARMYIGWFLWTVIPLGLTLFLLDLIQKEFVIGILTALFLGLAVGTAQNVATGAILSVVLSIGLGIILGTKGLLLVDILTSYWLGILIGFTNGFCGYVAGRVTNRNHNRAILRQTGAIVIGILVSTLVAGVTAALIAALAFGWRSGQISQSFFRLVYGLFFGTMFASAIGWRTGRWQYGILALVPSGIVFWSVTGTMVGGFAFAQNIGGVDFLRVVVILNVTTAAALLTLTYVVAERIAGSWAGAIAGMLASSSLHFLTGTMFDIYPLPGILFFHVLLGVLGLTYSVWRPIGTYPFQRVWDYLLFLRSQKSEKDLLDHHSVFWDEYQWLTSGNLVELLIKKAEEEPDEFSKVVSYLSNTPQRWAAQAAQLEIDARQLENCQTVEDISLIHQQFTINEFVGPAVGLLRDFQGISRDMSAALEQQMLDHQRQHLNFVEESVAKLLQVEHKAEDTTITDLFAPILEKWHQVIQDELQSLSRQIEGVNHLSSPYIIGDPLRLAHSTYIHREEIVEQIYKYRYQSKPKDVVFLYGQRRMGKTSLLINLPNFLPDKILSVFVDLQGVSTQAESTSGFFYNLARKIAYDINTQVTHKVERPVYQSFLLDPYVCFNQWLETCKSTILAAGYTSILLALDEYNKLPDAIGEGRIEERSLAHLEELSQSHPELILLLVSSVPLNKFPDWHSYFSDTVTITLSYLTESDTYRLIETPGDRLRLRYPKPVLEMIFALTQGHPYLVQLICNELIALKNEQDVAMRHSVSKDDINRVIPIIFDTGKMYFLNILAEIDQVFPIDLDEILKFIAKHDLELISLNQILQNYTLSADELTDALQVTCELGYLKEVNGHYQFRVPLIAKAISGLYLIEAS